MTNYRMKCTECHATFPTTDICAINGIEPVFCSTCGQIMVPEEEKITGFFHTWAKKFQQPEPDKTGHVYLMNEIGTDVYKIGATKNVPARLRQISQKSGRTMRLVYATPVPIPKHYDAENQILTKWGKLRTSGEWITASEDQVLKIVNDIIALEHGAEITAEAI